MATRVMVLTQIERRKLIEQGWFPYHVHGTYEDHGAPGPDSFEPILGEYVDRILADGFVVHPDHQELEFDGIRIIVRVLVKHQLAPDGHIFSA